METACTISELLFVVSLLTLGLVLLVLLKVAVLTEREPIIRVQAYPWIPYVIRSQVLYVMYFLSWSVALMTFVFVPHQHILSDLCPFRALIKSLSKFACYDFHLLKKSG